MSDIILGANNNPVTISLKAQPQGTLLQICYHTLNGNRPNANGNYVGLWASSNGNVPPNTVAAFSKLIDIDDTDADGWPVRFNLTSRGYVLGYCPTGDPADKTKDAFQRVCAVAPIGAITDAPHSRSISLIIEGDPTSQTVAYTAMNNMNCAQKCWIGIWEASQIIDGTIAPVFYKLITDPGSKGSISIYNMLLRGTDYQLGFFMNGYNADNPGKSSVKCLASLLTFSTSPAG